ncbi:MAG TPA: hypothetical protein VFH07_14570, partial [Chitinophagaceae bacterium]|nr:hypothetical protein [Chitinophagaceae bacterium]
VTSHEPQSAETIQILERFASVFNLTYRRFLDLEKAEAQARESELELALERVRAKSMSMRHSDELADLVKIVFKELTRIGFSVNACIIMTYDERTNDSTWWISNFDGVSNPVGLFVPNHFNEPYLAYLSEWKKQTTKWRYKLGGVEKKKWDQYIFKNSGLATLPDPVKTAMQSAEETYLNVCFNKYASITFGSFDPMSDKDFDTLHRFAKVFEQSYTRFLDLQKAEAQVREAQIETALERVRARTMGMHQSIELHDVIETVTTQLLALGLKFDNSVFCRVHEDESWEMWMSTPQQSYPSIIYVPYIDHRIFNNLKEVKAKNLEFYTDVFEQDEAMVFFKHFFENTIAKDVPEERKQYVLSSRGMARSLFLTKDIWFVISRYSPDPFNDEENAVLKRFAKVFEQSYIRFLDLEKAEAQANEARIEIALERIRARALAMHKSDELMEVAKVLWEQMALLGQPELEASVVHLYEQDPDHIHSWRAVSIGTESNTKLTYGHMAIPKHSCEFVREWLASFYSDLKEYTIEISGAKQEEWYDMLFQLAPDVVNSMRDKKSIHEKRFYRFSKFSGGALLMVSKQEPSEKVTYLQKRAAVVFDLAYRRFSDLQKAEAQAREAQIEASLERVRSKTMAMHDSQDVGETVATMFDELVKLGIETMRCGIGIMHDEYQMELWTARPDDRGKVDLIVGRLDMRLHPLLTGGYQSWKDKKDGFSYELKDD